MIKVARLYSDGVSVSIETKGPKDLSQIEFTGDFVADLGNGRGVVRSAG